MSRKVNVLVLVGLCALLLAWAAVAVAHEGDAALALIDADVQSGILSPDQALLYKLQYVFDRDALPAVYAPVGAAPVKCATPLLIEFEQRRATLPRAMVEQVESYLQVGGAKATYISPSGHFRMTYDTVGTNAVPAADTSPANGVPDYVEKCAQYMDTSWSTEIDVLGFNAPPTSPYYEVSFEEMSAYGYTQVVSGYTTRMVLENDFVGFPANDDPDGDALGAAKVTCAHEFKHASQRATSLWSEGGWVELDATWAEDVVFDATNDYYNYLGAGCGITSPSSSLDAGGTGSYEDCIWQIWMSETWSNDLIVDLWTWRATHQTQTMLGSYNYILTTMGSSISAGFPIYAAWNYATRTKVIAGFGYSEGSSYPNSLVTNNTVYPYSGSGTVNHLAATNIHCTGFTPGEAGNLRVQFNGDNTADIALIAVIKQNSGTSSWQEIPLDAANDADLELSVPLGNLNRVGFVIANAGQTGDNKTWTLDLSKVVDLPDPAVLLNVASLDQTLEPDQAAVQPLLLTNDGEVGSSLDYEVHLMATPPGVKRVVASAAAAVGPVKTPPAGLQESEIVRAPRYAGDCVFGNSDTSAILGYYGSWWAGNETYATRINPADYACGCNPGFNIRAIHMLLYLETTSTPSIQVHLAAAPAGCSAPGAILDSSAVVSVSGITANGYYDIEVPCDLACQDMGSEYFLLFEFLDANGPVGIPVDTAPTTCVDYNDWGSGFADVVSGYGFQGDWFIWADVDCCGVATPEVSVVGPNGGEYVAAGTAATVTWTATVVTDVKVEFSRDGGGSWELLSASTPNDGSEAFTLSGPASEQGLIRVGSTDGVYTDVSDAVFTVYDAVPWLDCTPTSGTLAQGANAGLVVGFDSTGLTAAVYTGYLVIISNALSSPDVVPVTLTVEDPGTGVGDVPFGFALRGNVPNPFNPATEIRFQLATAGHAVVEVLDLQGRVVRTLHDGQLAAGPATLSWDGRDAAGRRVASGAYRARLTAGGQTATHKMILAK
jgi:hypothetical protein